MIDLHCHLLPGIDDGAQTMAEALQLAQLAVDNGITHLVTTPHIHPGRYENDIDSIRSAYTGFTAAVKDAGLPLRVGMAAEVRVSMEILPMIAAGKIPFIGEYGGYHVMLMEFPHSHIIPGTDKLVDFLLQKKIRPMIVHPERNKEILRHLDHVVPFVERGCLLQVTAGSIAGQFGKYAQKCAEQMLQKGWVTILASDAHNREFRPPDLEAGRRAAAKIIGEEESWAMVLDRPALIAKQQFPEDEE